MQDRFLQQWKSAGSIILALAVVLLADCIAAPAMPPILVTTPALPVGPSPSVALGSALVLPEPRGEALSALKKRWRCGARSVASTINR